MRRIVVASILVIACRYEAPPGDTARPQVRERASWQRTDLTGKRVQGRYALQPKVLSRCEAGSQLGPDRLVSRPSATFRSGDPIRLSMWLAEAPQGLQVALRVIDGEGDEVGVARRDDAGGLRAVTLEVGDELAPGRYTLQGFWGGNLVCEKAIAVSSATDRSTGGTA